uniref:SH3 domain-containing protein n=1 Tax=Vannella robusta TaxID=1487602 RepID=A0A7S4HIR5_9EUKA|mmetsp:Transcript_1124/g.1383  ORF Transcript_1124/g.1383 Transcript_1124/m.1383 type:complete len:405 (+) Transcript_1124:44-1258(+)
MTTVKKIAKPIADEGSQETFRTVGVIKGSASDLSQLMRLARHHHQAQQAAIESHKNLFDHLVKITAKMEPRLADVSQAFVEISATEKQVATKQEEHNAMFTENLAKPIHQALQKERGTLQAFEKNYHKRHGEILVSIKKAEKATKKSGKKSADQLQQAIQDLTNTMNEMKKHRQDSLKEILLLERKRYCDVVELLNGIIDSQVETCNATTQALQGQQQHWKEVAQTYNKLSSDSEALLTRTGVKERTSTAIHGGAMSGSGYDEGYYEEGYDEGYYEEGYEEGYDEYYEGGEGYYEEGYEEGYDESASYSSGGYSAPTPAAPGGYGGSTAAASTGGYRAPPPPTPPSNGFRARALYDYSGTHDYELSFAAGDIITVTQEDAATGWWTGELNGVVGPFPGNYVERI